jgi:hypothetical protein
MDIINFGMCESGEVYRFLSINKFKAVLVGIYFLATFSLPCNIFLFVYGVKQQ